MTSIALHPTPRWQTVAKEQVSAVGTALRNEGILFLVALGILAALAIAAAIQSIGQPQHRPDFSYDPGLALPIALIGFVLPFGVWRIEDPARRSYHWAMPVARTPHTLIKAAAGWLWLMAAVVVCLLFVAGLSAAVVHITGYPPRMAPAAAWEWVIPFTSGTVAYLLGSTVVIASDHPWRWIMGVIVVYLIILAVLQELNRPSAVLVWAGIMNGYHGLQAAIFGDVKVRGARYYVASAARWLGATAIWGALGLIGVAGALFRRGDE